MYNVQYQGLPIFDFVNDEVLANRKASQTWPEIGIASSPNIRIICHQLEGISDSPNEALRDLYVSASACDVEPDIVELGLYFRGKMRGPH